MYHLLHSLVLDELQNPKQQRRAASPLYRQQRQIAAHVRRGVPQKASHNLHRSLVPPLVGLGHERRGGHEIAPHARLAGQGHISRKSSSTLPIMFKILAY
jgi:hypothetical protein